MENIHSDRVKKSISSKVLLFAFILICLGVIMLLRNTDMIDDQTYDMIFSWPTLVVAIGILNLSGRTFWLGVVLILFGGFFLAGDYLGLDLDFGKVFWPLLIILFGLMIIYLSSSKFTRKRFSKGESSQNRIEEVSIFGGVERLFHSEKFEGGEIINIFGGSKLDFRRSKLADGVNTIDMVNIFGGSSLVIPPEWDVQLEVVSIFGGFSDKRYNTTVDKTKTLIIKGVAIFGGGEIKTHE